MAEINNRKYAYQIGDIVNNVIITEQCAKKEKNGSYKKAYKYKCTICGYDCGEYYIKGKYNTEHKIIESNLKQGSGCVICSRNGFVAPEINSIHALTPFAEEFLIDKEDAFKYAPRSSSLIQCRCPDCGKEYIRRCDKLTNYGVACVCGDGFSYPEKFIFNLLSQLNIEFRPQYYLTNDSLLRYDFYIPQYKIILEVNGVQHYKQKWDRNEVENDKKKKDFALLNGIEEKNYVILDCRESNLEFIKKSVIESRLNKIFDFNSIDFVKCSEFASSNLMKQASELWNDGKTVKEISEMMKLHKHTIISYLKNGNSNKWCSYVPGDGISRYHNKNNNEEIETLS